MCYSILALRAWLIIVLLALAVGHPINKQENTSQKHQEKRKQSPPPPVVPIEVPPAHSQPAAQVEKQKPKTESPEPWREAFAPTTWPAWALVIVGFGAVWAALRTLKTIRRQALSMRRQTTILRKSVRVAERNARAARDGAEAAKANAEAAKANAAAAERSVELFIAKERTKIRLEINPLNLINPGMISVSYNLRVHGPTEAEALIISTAATALVTDSSEPADGGVPLPMGIPKVITKHIQVQNRTAMLQPKVRLEQSDIDSIHQQKTFVHFWGCIKYRDVFDERETAFRYLWRVTDITNFDGTRFCYWTNHGPAEDNRET